MQNVPVFEVIQYSYRFLFSEFRTILRLTWFPLLVATLVQLAVDFRSIDAHVAAGGFDRTLPGDLWWGILSSAVSALVYAMVAVALHRLILFDDRKPGTLLLFSLGRTEWLFIALALIAFAVGAVVLGPLVALRAAMSPAPDNPSILLLPVIILTFVAVAAGAYWWTRLMPLYPVMVVEKRLDFRAALDLSRGNFWRLVGVFLLGSLPVAIVFVIVSQVLFHGMVGDLTEIATVSVNPVQAVGDALKRYQLPLAIVGYAGSIVWTGLGVALICYTYKALRDIGPLVHLEESNARPAGA